ncbi:MAG: OmpL47-type beta-barrel domain-containing protein [Candidatus Baldrarchaeia archaeon]
MIKRFLVVFLFLCWLNVGLASPLSASSVKTYKNWYTDSTFGEDLIIYSDKMVYHGATSSIVTLKIVNPKGIDVLSDLAVLFEDKWAKNSKVKVEWIKILQENVPYQVPVTTCEKLTCAYAYDENKDINGSVSRFYYCKGTKKPCQYDEKTGKCYYKKCTTTHETRYKDEWVSVPLTELKNLHSKVSYREYKGKKFHAKIGTKAFKNLGKVFKKNNTIYLQLKIAYPFNSQGEFAIATENAFLDPWWNSNWQYKRAIEITNPVDYNKWNVIKLPSIDMSSWSVCSDLNDVIVVDENIMVDLNRIVECNGTKTDCNVYFELANNLPASTYSTQFYLYYGNNACPSPKSDMDKTNADKWEDGDWTTNPEWILSMAETHSITDDPAGIYGKVFSLTIDSVLNGDQTIENHNLDGVTDDFKFRWRLRFTGVDTGNALLCSIYSADGNFYRLEIFGSSQTSAVRKWISGTITTIISSSLFLDTNTWYDFRVERENGTISFWIDDNLQGTATNTEINDFDYVKCWWNWANTTMYTDLLTYDVALEPTFTVGAEETSNTAPTVSLNSPQQGYFSGTVTIDFNVQDADIQSNADGNLFVDIYYSSSQYGFENAIIQDGNLFDSSTFSCTDTNFSVVQTCTYTWDISGVADGNYFIDINVHDDSDTNKADTSDFSIMVDNTAPTTTDDAPSGWQASDVTVTLTPSDSGSGVHDTNYCIDTDNTCTPNISSTSVNVTCSAGSTCQKYVRYRSVDRAGNVEAINSVLVQIDKEAPTTTDNAPTGWQTSPFSFTLTADDGSGSGVSSTAFRIDGGDWNANTTVWITTDGNYQIDYNSTDNVGNIETTKTIWVALDTVAPTTTDDHNAGWQTIDQNVHLTCSDTTSGCDIIQYRIDGGAWQTYDPATGILFTTDGNFQLDYNARDVAGNIETTKTIWIAVDKTAPTTTDNASSTWTASDVVVTLTPSDSTSGVASTYYCVDNDGTCTPTTEGTSVSVTCASGSVCEQYVRYYSTDNAGNSENIKTSVVIRIDKQAPTTTDNAPSGWQTSDVNVLLTCSDGTGSGCVLTQYRLWEGTDVNTAIYDDVNFYVGSQNAGAGKPHIFFKTDGTKMYLVAGSDNPTDTKTIYQYVLSVPWDITTASYTDINFYVNQTGNLLDVFFKPDGTKMYVLIRNAANGGGGVYQYSLSTAWDINSASYDGVYLDLDYYPYGLFFKPDGTKVYILDNISEDVPYVHQFALTTAWDISTASLDGNFCLENQDAGMLDIFIKQNDGSKLYSIGTVNDMVYQYTLSTAWDITTATYEDVNFSVTTEDGYPTSLFFKPHETKMYVVGGINETLFQYSLPPQWQTYNPATGIFFSIDDNYRLDYNSSDLAGNVETSHTIWISIDKIAPKTTSSGYTDSIWTTDAVTVSFTCDDLLSGVETSGCDITQYRIDSTGDNTISFGSWQTYSGSFTLSADGNYAIDFSSSDIAGNKETAKREYILIDTIKPFTLAKDFNNYNNVWMKLDQNLILECSDTNPDGNTTSGCSTIMYRLDTDPTDNVSYGAWQVFDGNILFSSDGNYAIDFNSKDVAGNSEDVNTLYVLIDKTAPVAYTRNFSDDAVISSRYLIFDVNDAFAGVEDINVLIDGVASTSFNFATHCTQFDTNYHCEYEEALIKENKTYTITIQYIDLAVGSPGNSGSIDVNVLFTGAPQIVLNAPVGGEYISGTYSIDFNVQDLNIQTNADGNLWVDIYYSSSAFGFENAIIQDGNLFDSSLFTCDDYNFADSTNCTYSWNTTLVTDGNYFIDVNVHDDADLNDIASSDSSFMVDNNKPWIIPTTYTSDGTTNSSYPVFKATPGDEESDVSYCLVDLYRNGTISKKDVVVAYSSGECSYTVTPKLENGEYVKVTWNSVDLAGNVSDDVNSGQITYLETGQMGSGGGGGGGGAPATVAAELGKLGDPCEVDADCESPLICDPKTKTCQYSELEATNVIDYRVSSNIINFIPDKPFNYSILVVNKTEKEISLYTTFSEELKDIMQEKKVVEKLPPLGAVRLEWVGVVEDENTNELSGKVFIFVDNNRYVLEKPLLLKKGTAFTSIAERKIKLPILGYTVTLLGLAMLVGFSYMLWVIFTSPKSKKTRFKLFKKRRSGKA